MTDKILRADSTAITGIKSCVFKEQRNTETNLRFGACAASSIEFEVYGAQSSAPAVGEVLTYYQTDSNGTDTLIGKFIAQPSIPGRNTFKVIAYDNIILLETDFSEHLATIQTSFPMTLSAFLTEVASVSGVTFGNSPALASTSIAEFSAAGVSCRQVVAWAAEMSGQYVYADTSGNICFGWYSTNSAYKIYPTSGSSGGVTYVPYKQGGLDYKDFAVATVDCVAVKPPEEEDVAYIYPLNGSGNTYTVTDNLLLSGASSAVMTTVAQTLYTALTGLSAYRPMTARVFREENPLRAGDIVAVQDAQGVTFNTIVMSMTVAMDGVTLECAGTQTYDADSGSGVRQQLVNLASNIVRINKLKVNWAEIDTAIINYLTANDVTAQNLTIVDAADNVIATFNNGGITFYNNGVAVANYNSSVITLGNPLDVHAEIDDNSFELYDQSNNKYTSIGDLRDANGDANVIESFLKGSNGGAGITANVNFNISSINSILVDGVTASGYTFSGKTITFATTISATSVVEVDYVTTDSVYHYDLGTRSGTTGAYSVALGKNAEASNTFSAVGGGQYNTASGWNSTVAGGSGNTASGIGSAVGGGTGNTASGDSACVSGGDQNTADGNNAGIVGGENNQASGNYSFVGGGTYNNATNTESAAVGGELNTASGGQSFVGGGYDNTASSSQASVVGGNNNGASGQKSSAVGGYSNTASGENAIVLGGEESEASGDNSAVVGGDGGRAVNKSQLVFGEFNVADPSGNNTDARGDYVEIVGNGTADNARSNARTLDWNGNERLAGKLYVNGGTDEVATLSSIPVTSVDNRTGAVSTVPFLVTFNITDPFTTQVDALTEAGSYTFSIPYNNADMPQTNYGWNGIIQMESTSYITVIACKTGASPDVYRLNKNNGTWGSWTRLALASDLTAWSFEPNNTSTLTSQIDALTANGVYSFYILSYGHQSATGMPTNANYYGIIFRGSASYVTVMAFPVGTKNIYLLNKSGGTWGTWSQNS